MADQVTAPSAPRNAPGRDALVAALRAWGVGFLQPGDGAHGPPPPTGSQLLTQLAESPDPRLRTALAILLVRHPELAEQVPALVENLIPPTALTLKQEYTAAVYLQRMWWSRLRGYLPALVVLPDYFSAELALPGPDDRFGKTGLLALSARSPTNFWASHDAMIRQLFSQLRFEFGHELAPAG